MSSVITDTNLSPSSHIAHGSDDHILWNLSSFHCDLLMQVYEVSWLSEEHCAFEVTPDKKVEESDSETYAAIRDHDPAKLCSPETAAEDVSSPLSCYEPGLRIVPTIPSKKLCLLGEHSVPLEPGQFDH